MIRIDGDFSSNLGNCEHHCSPSCHPMQVGPNWVYGCRHEAWPPNRQGDFVPIVNCGGDRNNCQLATQPFLRRYVSGLNRRKKNLENKLKLLQDKIDEINNLGEKNG